MSSSLEAKKNQAGAKKSNSNNTTTSGPSFIDRLLTLKANTKQNKTKQTTFLHR
jgi:hypothetical protein